MRGRPQRECIPGWFVRTVVVPSFTTITGQVATWGLVVENVPNLCSPIRRDKGGFANLLDVGCGGNSAFHYFNGLLEVHLLMLVIFIELVQRLENAWMSRSSTD